MYQQDNSLTSGRWLFQHILGDEEGWMVTFTGRQARLDNPEARPNELTRHDQRSWSYPDDLEAATKYLTDESNRGRDAYFGVHRFVEPGNRLRANSHSSMSCLWLDEDDGRFPDSGPEPTAIVHSSSARRHLYWQLTHPLSAEWIVAMNRRIAAWASGDSGKAGLSSVLRVPGTTNFKRHPQLDPVTLKVTGAEAWDPAVMEQAIPPRPAPKKTTRLTGPYTGPEIDLVTYLESSDVEILGSVLDGGGSKFAIICPWLAEHSGGDRTGTFVGQFANGAMWFHCHHEHCQGRTWQDFRRRFQTKRGVVNVNFSTSGAPGVVGVRLG